MATTAELCQELHSHWFQLRDELERSTGADLSYRVPIALTRYPQSLGMCKGYGDRAYLSVPLTLVNNTSTRSDAAGRLRSS